MVPCRKCGTSNPESNGFCRKCGAALLVSTAMVKAQKKPMTLPMRGLRWRWVALGALAMLGLSGILVGAVVAVGVLVFEARLEAGVSGGPLGLPVAAAIAFLVAFGLGGVYVARLSRGRTIAEPFIAALIVMGLFAAIGAALSPDLVFVAAVLAVPCSVLAALGGWFGELFEKGGDA
ncbi:MAG: zinc ribbon domain-containing protein [Deltaproteobacteria bacterium]|nr:zinc ribbon domain-containing protein [Deltaproteobacteria bacterium]